MESYFNGKRVRASGQMHRDGEDGVSMMLVQFSELEVVGQ